MEIILKPIIVYFLISRKGLKTSFGFGVNYFLNKFVLSIIFSILLLYLNFY